MKSLLILSILCLSGCGKENKPDPFAGQEKYSDMSYKLRNCAQEQLSVMAKSDHVQKWDAELYNAVADKCEDWYGFKKEKP